MSKHLTPLGYGRFFRDENSGLIVVDGDSVRRSGFAGEESGPNPMDAGSFEGPPFGYEGEPPPGDGFGYAGPEGEGFQGEDFGAWNDPRSRGYNRYPTSQQGRSGYPGRSYYPNRPAQHAGYPGQPQRYPQMPNVPGFPQAPRQETARDAVPGLPSGWAMTAVNGVSTLDAAGSTSVAIRLQHDFIAHDVTLEGSASGAKVTSIYFGAKPVWSSPNGIPATVFGVSSYIRGLLKGQTIKAGLDITVNGVLTGAGDLAVTFFGMKPND